MFLYWIPNQVEAPKQAKLIEFGLGYVFDDRAPTYVPAIPCGPDGNSGHLATFHTNPKYIAETQVWQPLPDNKHGVMVGLFKHLEPMPEDFARDELLEGEQVDGWEIPRAIEFVDADGLPVYRTALPTHLKYAGDGQWYPGDIKEKYRNLWTLAENYQTQLDKALSEGKPLPDGRISYTRPAMFHQVAVSAVQTNYRIGPTELEMLKVYDVEFAERVVDALLDRARLADLLKKKASLT